MQTQFTTFQCIFVILQCNYTFLDCIRYAISCKIKLSVNPLSTLGKPYLRRLFLCGDFQVGGPRFLVDDTIIIRYTIELVVSSGGALSRVNGPNTAPKAPLIQVHTLYAILYRHFEFLSLRSAGALEFFIDYLYFQALAVLLPQVLAAFHGCGFQGVSFSFFAHILSVGAKLEAFNSV